MGARIRMSMRNSRSGFRRLRTHERVGLPALPIRRAAALPSPAGGSEFHLPPTLPDDRHDGVRGLPSPHPMPATPPLRLLPSGLAPIPVRFWHCAGAKRLGAVTPSGRLPSVRWSHLYR
eukprot:NODE_3158_length_485_cov_6.559633_g2741_i0.p3 GENE.NODE_3158_length_485_cov_6.559633_g2741_i0~~NODE_3158_length_485_cov_6.559633_g2741_i0.p3  ORF type:complete len:127 (+),score=18.44 NODE_3158_length_485_cov_6.559633_g2741_i0:26-382(+)